MDVLLDGALGDLEAELEQFTPDPFGAPGAVILGHVLDERHDARSQRGSALLSLAPRLAPPDPSKEFSMPTQERIGLDNQQCCFPAWQSAGYEHKQATVTPGEYRTFSLPLEHDELLTEECVFKHQFRLAARQVQGRIETQRLVFRLSRISTK